MIEVLVNSIPIFATIVATLWYRHKKSLPENFSSSVSFIAFKIVVPVLLFQILSRADFGSSGHQLIGLSVVMIFALLMSGWLLSRILTRDKKEKGVLRFSQLDFYVYGFGMPFILANFDQNVVSRIVLMDTVVYVFYLVFGGIIASYSAKTKKSIWSMVSENTVMSIVFWSIIVSLFVNLLKIPIPRQVYDLSSFFSSSFSLLAALLIGSNIKLPKLNQLFMSLTAYGSRLLVAGLVIFVASLLMSLDKIDQTALWLTFTVPIGSLGILFAEKYNNDKNLMTQLHLTSFSIALFIYPILIMWLRS